MTKAFSTALLLTGLTAISMPAFSADKPATQTGASASMLANTCAGCHGTGGNSAGPASPSIAGMSKTYLSEMMNQFKAGETPATIMDRIAKGYSEEEIELISDFYSKKKYVAAAQTTDAGLVKKGAKLHDKYCEKCHSEQGTLADDDSGFLGGQWAGYLQMTMADFRSGDREMTKKMKKKVNQMIKKKGDASFDSLLHYYASVK